MAQSGRKTRHASRVAHETGIHRGEECGLRNAYICQVFLKLNSTWPNETHSSCFSFGGDLLHLTSLRTNDLLKDEGVDRRWTRTGVVVQMAIW